MIDSSFELIIVTPVKIFKREIMHLRLKDETGFFGIMKNHTDFLTVLMPSLGYYTDLNGKEVFLAVDGGVLSIRRGTVTLTSREVFESENAEALSQIIDKTILNRTKAEASFSELLKGIEREFMEKSIEFEKGR